jgi:hypothetical protein
MSSFGEVTLHPSYRQAYRATSGFFAPVATPTDIATFYGSSTKTIRLLKIEIVALEANADYITGFQAFLIKRSTTPSGGSATSLTQVPENSNNNAGTATNVSSYTANPTPGSAVGNVASAAIVTVNIANPATAVINQSATPGPYILYECQNQEQAITLNSTSEGVAVNLNSVTVLGTSVVISVTFVWTEE